MRKTLTLGLAAVLALSVPVPARASVPARGEPLGPPRVLPGDAVASALPRSPDSWLVGAKRAPALDRLARRFGASPVLRSAAVFRVRRDRARTFGAALRARGLYAFSEPDRPARRFAYPADPLSGWQWAAPAIGATRLDPPPIGAARLALLENDFDASHPEWAGASIDVLGSPSSGLHGTAVASVAAAPANGRGIVGIWPGARVLISAARNGGCGAAASAIEAAVRRRVDVISMSYGFVGGCYTHSVATNYAFGRGVVQVAAGGNDGRVGLRTYISPASDPHVITVAALEPGLRSPVWSNANEAIDVSAPGDDVLAAVPVADDHDGVRDGYAAVSGTSFSAPIVAAAAAWVVARRQRLDHTQVTDLLRSSTRDLGRRGWDPEFGYGVVDLTTALRAGAPISDPLEPNDDIEWVNGRHLRPHRPAYTGRSRTIRARVDQLEDPADVYGVRLPARSSLRVRVRPLGGNPDVEVYSRRARTIFGRRGKLAGSHRRGRIDTVYVTNRSPRGRWAWIDVIASGRTLDAEYRLGLRPVPYRARAVRLP